MNNNTVKAAIEQFGFETKLVTDVQHVTLLRVQLRSMYPYSILKTS